MNYYYIIPRTCLGDLSNREGKNVLFIDEFELDFKLFLLPSNQFIVTMDLKLQLEELDALDFTFSKLENVEFRQDFSTAFEVKGKLQFWLVEFNSSKKFTHFCYWKNRYLVVSDVALELLLQNQAYKDYFSGSAYGKEFETLVTRYFLTSDIETYFDDKFQLDNEIVKNKNKKSMDFYRKLNGLPPLKS